MIPHPPDMKLVPPGPYVLAENPGEHKMVITTLKDWGDGRGSVPQIYSPLVEWKQRRSGAGRGRAVVWRGFDPVDVAIAYRLLELLNSTDSRG